MSQSDSSSSDGKSLGYLKREEIIGKPVVATDAVVLGTVRDVAVSLDGKAALQLDGKNGGADMYVGSDEIQALGDVVLLNRPSKRSQPAVRTQQPSYSPSIPMPASTPPPQASTIPPPPTFSGPAGRMCPRCAYTNTPTAKFCIKCGSPMT